MSNPANKYESGEQVVFDEFSPKKFFLQIGDLLHFLRRKWLLIILAAVLAGFCGALYERFTKDNLFMAEMSFMVEEETGKQKSIGLSEISEELGLGPTDPSNFFGNESNFSALVTSRMMFDMVLRSKVPMGDTSMTFADFFLDSLNYRNKWMAGANFPDTRFDRLPSENEEKHFQNRIIQQIRTTMLTRYFKLTKQSPGSNILVASCATPHELFSMTFLNALISQVSNYYTDVMTRRTRTNLDAIQRRIDSVNRAYTSALYGKAAISDANINVVRETATVPGQRKQADIDLLRSTYLDLSMKLENAKVSLLKNTPVIEILDAPVLPLNTISRNFLKKFLLFSFLGLVLASFAFAAVWLYRLIMQEEVLEDASDTNETAYPL